MPHGVAVEKLVSNFWLRTVMLCVAMRLQVSGTQLERLCHGACSKAWRRKRGHPPNGSTCELQLAQLNARGAARRLNGGAGKRNSGFK